MEPRYFLGINLAKLSPTQVRFIKGLVAELLGAAASYLTWYFTERPECAVGMLVLLPLFLQTISEYLKEKRALLLPF